MTIKQIYDLAVRMGVDADFRGKKRVQSLLRKTREKYEKLDKDEKEVFDKERLTNPYSDTRILWGSLQTQVKKALVGIDIDAPELLIARGLKDIDLVISHHPRGIALAGLDDVMHLQADILNQYGVPIHLAEGLLKIRISEVARGIHPGNHERTVDAARLLGMPYICAHTPTDNLVATFLKREVTKKNPETVGELITFLKGIPEYKEARKQGMGPRLYAGNEENRVGKIAFTELTGGTEGSADLYERLSVAGVGTIVGMHVSEKHKEAAEKAHLNAVIAGHMSSDSIGMNLFLDELEKRGMTIVPTSGLIRFSRAKKRK